jgi:hypothetical protein
MNGTCAIHAVGPTIHHNRPSDTLTVARTTIELLARTAR